MTSLQRSVVSIPASCASSAALWKLAFAVVAIVGLLVLRACGYELDTVASYAAYVVFYVALPGAVLMQLVQRGPLSLALTVALAVPTGFAIEIFTFLGMSALGAREAYPWVPILWILAATLVRWRTGRWPVRLHVSAHHAGIAAAAALVFLGTAVMAISQMYAEAPLAEGLPTRAIFHDWVYLVSRAGVIKNHWPLDDPSLSGTPLQYHYFMMVHAAAASWTTGVEISAVMLRLAVVPLGAVLVAQAYVLGRAVARSPWGGVLAAWLTVAASEVSFASSYGQPMFLGLFVRWLFVSPTFFFGIVFCGALLIAIWRCARLARCEARHYAWLMLLGTAATGAKGTVPPVLLCALGAWAAWRWVRERRLPWRLAGFGACLGFAFVVVYVPTMLAWRTGDAAFRPFHVFQLTDFWKQHLPVWQAWFAAWLPQGIATPLATWLCAAVVFAGTCGVRLLAIPYLFGGDLRRRDRLLVAWMGAFFVASCAMGLLLELNSYGELYVVLLMRLPMAVLAAGFCVAAARRVRRWWREPRAAPLRGARWTSVVGLAAAACVFAAALAVQTGLWFARNRTGFAQWLGTPADLKPDDYMQQLREALLWVRANTEPDAVLVANAFTPENMRKDHWGALDRTLMGVHFYYSALSERRLWFEGTHYALDTTRVRLRANLASSFFYRRRPIPAGIVNSGPCYVLLDRSLNDGAGVPLPPEQRIFANARIEIYRMSDPPAEPRGVLAAGESSH